MGCAGSRILFERTVVATSAPTLAAGAYKSPNYESFTASSMWFSFGTVVVKDTSGKEVFSMVKKSEDLLEITAPGRALLAVVETNSSLKRSKLHAVMPSFKDQPESLNALFFAGELNLASADYGSLSYLTTSKSGVLESAYTASSTGQGCGAMMTVKAADGTVIAKCISTAFAGAELQVAEGADVAVVALLFMAVAAAAAKGGGNAAGVYYGAGMGH